MAIRNKVKNLKRKPKGIWVSITEASFLLNMSASAIRHKIEKGEVDAIIVKGIKPTLVCIDVKTSLTDELARE